MHLWDSLQLLQPKIPSLFTSDFLFHNLDLALIFSEVKVVNRKRSRFIFSELRVCDAEMLIHLLKHKRITNSFLMRVPFCKTAILREIVNCEVNEAFDIHRASMSNRAANAATEIPHNL
jgi:hypothetical protein